METKALVNLRNTSATLKKSHLVVVSYNGVILLTGQVPDPSTAQQAEDVVKKLRDVETVHNQLTVEPNTSFARRSQDTWITGKLKTKMFGNRKVKSSDIKIVTENSTVYLMGLVDREMADRAADLARNTSGVKRVVKIFEYID